MATYTTKIAHVHLKVRDLQQSIEFYTKYFDLKVVVQIGNQYVFLSGSDFHHELALQAVGLSASAPNPRGVGLYHIAFEVPDRESFAKAYEALTQAGVDVGVVDHLISWAMYFDDPDGNGLEIYWDTRAEPHGKQLWHGQNIRLTEEQIFAVIESI
jgi:catechol 2,3-dioxygenase